MLNKLIDRLVKIEEGFREEDSKIFKIRDLHQIKGSIFLIMSHYDSALQ